MTSEEAYRAGYQSGYHAGYQDGYQFLKLSMPEIVRCKDCKHRDPEDGRCDSGHDIRWNLQRPDDWFCADGEKK